MANYKKEWLDSLCIREFEGSPEVVIRRLKKHIQDARGNGYTNLSLKYRRDGEWEQGFDLYGFKVQPEEAKL